MSSAASALHPHGASSAGRRRCHLARIATARRSSARISETRANASTTNRPRAADTTRAGIDYERCHSACDRGAEYCSERVCLSVCLCVRVVCPRPTNQSCIFRVVQVIKSLQDPLEVGNNLPGSIRGSVIMPRNEAWNRNVYKR